MLLFQQQDQTVSVGTAVKVSAQGNQKKKKNPKQDRGRKKGHEKDLQGQFHKTFEINGMASVGALCGICEKDIAELERVLKSNTNDKGCGKKTSSLKSI